MYTKVQQNKLRQQPAFRIQEKYYFTAEVYIRGF